ncbi:uncharacterized protein LOC110441449 isoform X2 [Mizuhopecten yessoensis]|uniref:uncharacterized protein LOC110441449 isoform X2 n=1 Tax=Mizuhopecten yessoensis TaxID=6573 RepID=UPI000B45DE2A|nr:uncharacterized protein LOC110441449 isoform X2 [Mizuhopecten yessoensis]
MYTLYLHSYEQFGIRRATEHPNFRWGHITLKNLNGQEILEHTSERQTKTLGNQQVLAEGSVLSPRPGAQPSPMPQQIRLPNSGSNFFMLPQPMTALEAYTACKENNSILALPGKDDIETLDTVLNNTESLGAWTGEYVDFAPWAFAKGCYTIFNTSRHNTSYSGSTCFQSCDKNLKESECICDISRVDTTLTSLYNLCNKPCSRDGGACGGVGRLYTEYLGCMYYSYVCIF